MIYARHEWQRRVIHPEMIAANEKAARLPHREEVAGPWELLV